MDKNDKNNRRRKKEEESEDILGMIRKHQEHTDPEESANFKLRLFLDNLNQDEIDSDVDYSDTPIYKLGFEDGFNEAEELFNQKMRNVPFGKLA